MFDNTNPPAGAVPNNLPMGEPEDMFSGTGVGSTLPEPQPLAKPTTAMDAGVLKPKMTTPPVAAPTAMPALMPEPELPMDMPQMVQSPIAVAASASSLPRREAPMPMPMSAGSEGVLAAPLGGHKTLITVIVVLSLIIVGGGAVWAYTTFINPSTPVVPTTAVVVPTSTVNNTTNTTQTSTTTIDTTNSATSTDSRILFGEPVLDTDSDGLDDSVERERGTNMLAWDSDGDTLSDGDEVLTWKTDPLKADTDGDTYEDASEIKNGYNPNGPGKLFAVNSTSTAATTTSTEPK